MPKLKSDSHGLYFRTNGSVFRPFVTAETQGYHKTTDDGKTQFVVGESVKVKHISQTPLASIKADNKEEFWHSHGSYLDLKNNCKVIASNLIWKE